MLLLTTVATSLGTNVFKDGKFAVLILAAFQPVAPGTSENKLEVITPEAPLSVKLLTSSALQIKFK